MIKRLMENRKFSIAFIIIIAIEIFLVSSIPGGPPSKIPDFSLLYHFVAFFLFNFFLLTTFRIEEKITSKKMILVLIISLVYAVLDELHQFFVPLRTPDLVDFLVDSAGIFLSAFAYKYYSNKK